MKNSKSCRCAEEGKNPLFITTFGKIEDLSDVESQIREACTEDSTGTLRDK